MVSYDFCERGMRNRCAVWSIPVQRKAECLPLREFLNDNLEAVVLFRKLIAPMDTSVFVNDNPLPVEDHVTVAGLERDQPVKDLLTQSCLFDRRRVRGKRRCHVCGACHQKDVVSMTCLSTCTGSPSALNFPLDPGSGLFAGLPDRIAKELVRQLVMAPYSFAVRGLRVAEFPLLSHKIHRAVRIHDLLSGDQGLRPPEQVFRVRLNNKLNAALLAHFSKKFSEKSGCQRVEMASGSSTMTMFPGAAKRAATITGST